MKKLLLLLLLISNVVLSQTVKIDNCRFTIKHKDVVFYLDKDTCSYISVHTITHENLLKLDGDRDDKWHKEWPKGPYNKQAYVRTGYDLGHLTPAHITSYNDSIQYTSFSMFNQAPQLADFNRGQWKKMEMQVEKGLLAYKGDAIIITGVIYDNNKKVYLKNSRVKIPIMFYKIVVTKNGNQCFIGSNINGTVTKTTLTDIKLIAKKNGNVLNITIK